MRTSVRSDLDGSTNITLLGDAIHAMTPPLGRGTTLAMRHGTLLERDLGKATEGRGSLAAELWQNEK